MKFVLLVVSALALVAFSKAYSVNPADLPEGEPAFIRSIKELYKGPPKQLDVTSRATVTTHWITQKLDNFDTTDTRTWEMRYMENNEYFENGGPIFIEVGGEWDIHPSAIMSGHFVDLAKEHKGILYYTEHRYYGESRPTSDIRTSNLKYLDIKQALADLAHFIRTKRASNPALANSKVILAGCSYAATMVTWFRRLYPELIDGGFGSSGPLLAQVDFLEYMEVVGKTMRVMGSDACYNRMQNGIAELEEMLTGRRSAEARAMLKLCNSFDTKNRFDIYTVFSSFAYIFAGLVQYQRGDDVKVHCDFLMSFKDDVSAMANYWLWAYGYPTGCIDARFSSTVWWYSDTSFNNGWLRPWFYQTCNEYGWYQTSASANQPFGSNFPVDLSTTLCREAFGSVYTDAHIQSLIDHTNEHFGGMNANVDRIYTTHGGLDPWSPMGKGEAEGATIIPYASHCADLGSISSSDSKEMRASKERLAELVREWLA